MKADPKKESKSFGSLVAEKARAKANGYTDEKRNSLRERGMALIYGGANSVH